MEIIKDCTEMCGLFLFSDTLDNSVIITLFLKGLVRTENKYYAKYNGEIMPLSELARRIGVDYRTLRRRAQAGRDISRPSYNLLSQKNVEVRETISKDGAYSFLEFVGMYKRFQIEKDALDILADFACMKRGSEDVIRLKERIEKYIMEEKK